MIIKEIKPINFLYFSVETTIQELIKYVPIGQALYKEATSQNIHITGPIHWHYFGFEGDESKSFKLEVLLPVAEIPQGYDGQFHVKRTDSFKCVSAVHEGGWLDIPKTYGILMGYLSANNLKATAINREIYINVDIKNPDANVTEIQMGI